jgi:hypothetical protein
MSQQINNGINAQSFSAQNVAVGPHARVVQTNWLGEVRGQLAELQREIESFQGPKQTRQELMQAHAEVTEELGAPEPDKSKVLAALERIRQLAGPAAAIGQAAVAVAQVMAAVL